MSLFEPPLIVLAKSLPVILAALVRFEALIVLIVKLEVMGEVVESVTVESVTAVPLMFKSDKAVAPAKVTLPLPTVTTISAPLLTIE